MNILMDTFPSTHQSDRHWVGLSDMFAVKGDGVHYVDSSIFGYGG